MNIYNRMVALASLALMMLSLSAVAAEKYSTMADSEIDARIRYLDNSFESIEDPYTYWQYGWTAVYAGSGAMQIYNAIDEDDSDDQTKEWVGAVKSVGGVAMMTLKPVPLVAGMGDYKSMPQVSREDKIARLIKAEKMLEQTAWRSDDRYTFKPHAMTVGVNLLGALAIVAFGDSSDALGSAALGIAVGEAAIWTQPVVAKDKWNDYNGQFNGAKSDAVSWQLIPKFNGAELVVQF